MKKSLMVLLLCLLIKQMQAQDVFIRIVISDISQIIGYSGPVPQFNDPNINTIFSNYNVTRFAKSFPYSGYEHMLRMYSITCDSIGLAEELYNYDSMLFPKYEVHDSVRFLSHWPTDWDTRVNDTDMFNLVHAPEAWAISQGDSNIIIGVLDTKINLVHPDLKGKYAHITTNNDNGGPVSHGTFVSGLIAARTNNDTGVTGMGYNCRLHSATDNYNDEINKMAKDTSIVRTRIINISWDGGPVGTTKITYASPFGYTSTQDDYNEVYESGVVVVAAAGNGKTTQNPNDKPSWFSFPASYDHNISVTSVGHHNNSGTKNVKFIHELFPGDSTAINGCHNHNTRVDLCAPGYDVSSCYNDVFNGKYYSYRENSGTSFASPIVAGAVGLILAKRPWFTPYQVEYILKKSATDIYSYPANQVYAQGPSRFTGRLGAGALNAGAALNMTNVDTFFQHHPDAKTFRIKGVKVNTLCIPGAYPGVPHPRLEVMMENGMPPYTYKWERYQGTAQSSANITPQFDSIGTMGPIIGTISSKAGVSMPWSFKYRLTVYDNSEIQKVASKIIELKLHDDPVWDLAMQDAYSDLMDEPNTMITRNKLDWDIWTSPDIWNRFLDDGDSVHQDPANLPAANFMHARVKNIGCVASPTNAEEASLEMYWTLASTGEVWPLDWISRSWPGTAALAGDYITSPGGIPIPSIPPGGQTILSHNWVPPIPQEFDTTLTRIDVCALARIINRQGPPHGMTFQEIDTTKVNVLNNNNIVTRNFVSINLNPPGPPVVTPVIIGNPSGGGTGGTPPKGVGTFTMQIATENQLQPYIHGYLASYMDVAVHLGNLYDIWTNGGSIGNHSSFSDLEKTVTWNMEQPLRLENIILDEAERHMIKLEYRLKPGLTIPYDVNDIMHVRLISPELVDLDMGDGTAVQVYRDKVHGAVNYEIIIPSSETGENKAGKTKIDDVNNFEENAFDIYPNPVNGKLTLAISDKTIRVYNISVTDVMGRNMFEVDAEFKNGLFNINTDHLTPGIYHVHITDKTGNTRVRKFVKVD